MKNSSQPKRPEPYEAGCAAGAFGFSYAGPPGWAFGCGIGGAAGYTTGEKVGQSVDGYMATKDLWGMYGR